MLVTHNVTVDPSEELKALPLDIKPVKKRSTAAGGKLHTCEICFADYTKSAKLRAHMVKVHGREELVPYSCPLCDKRFVLSLNLDRHMADEHGDANEAVFQCGDCDQVYPTAEALK